jgi:hypothetical protein
VADVPVINTDTGEPTTLPVEAVEAEHAKGKIAFAPGSRVPAILDGNAVTIPAERINDAIASGRAKLNFDPSGATKAAAAGAIRGASLGLTDWLAVEEGKLLKGHEGGEYVRKTLQGLRESHPDASTAGELGGALASMFIPGGAEADVGKAGAEGLDLAEGAHAAGEVGGEVTPLEAAEQAKAQAQTTQATQTGASLGQSASAAQAVSDADAASGRTVGSALGSIFRNANPNAVVGRGGAATEDYLAPLFGDKAATLARWGTEGAIIDAANAADEQELGDTPTTGETYLAAIEHGALYGSLMGLVGTGAEKALTGAGRIAARISEGRLGGTAGQYRKALDRWGPGVLGDRAMEEGLSRPFLTDAERYEMAKSVSTRDGELLDNIAREADAAYNGMNAAESRQALHGAIDRAQDDGRLAGGNLDAMAERLKQDFDTHIGWKDDPNPLDRLPDDAPDRLYDHAWQAEAKRGLMPPTTPPPPEVTERDVRGRWRELADADGLGWKTEKSPKVIKPADMEAYRQRLVTRFASATDMAERQRLGVQLATPGALEAGARVEIEAGVAARNARRAELRQIATDQLNERYAKAKDQWDHAMSRHTELRNQASQRIAETQAQRDRTYAHMVSAIRRDNASLRVPFTSVRQWRSKLDDIIPWSRGQDAVTNAIVEMKKSARSALEDRLEHSLDEAARKSPNPEITARYIHAKNRYGQAKDIERMLERQRGREASRFGREVFGHYGGILGHALGGAMFGHPVAGAGVGIAKKYAPTVAAWAVHKMSRLAEMKALRSEIEVAMRRSTRAAAAGREVPRFATVGVPSLPPHELRRTAAEAMIHVVKMSRGNDLAARIAALDPSLSILAPQASTAVEGAARRALTYMVSKIPTRVMAALGQGHEPTGRDLSDKEAREFLEGAAVAHDPRFATDALAHGQLTPGLAVGLKAVWPSLHAQTQATIARQAAMDHASFDGLTPGRKTQFGLLGGMSTLAPKGMTLALQQSAASMAGASSAKPIPQGGKVNAASGLSKMSAANMLELSTQALEGNSAGRRPRRAAGSL